jgi:hypothetical protein
LWLGNSLVKVPLSLLSNGSVKNPLIVARQWLGKRPPIVAGQRLGKNPLIFDRLSCKQASSSLLLAFASMVILGVEPHRLACWFLSELIFSTLKMEAICSYETSVDTQRTTRRYIPEIDTLEAFTCFGPNDGHHQKATNTSKENASRVLHACCLVWVTLGLEIVKIDLLKLIKYLNSLKSYCESQ